MSYKTEPYNQLANSFSKHAIDLDKGIYFIPENIFDCGETSNFIYSETTSDLRKILKKGNVQVHYLTEDKPLLRSRKGADWFGPTLLFGLSVIVDDPHLIDIGLNLVSSYLYDFFKGKIGDKSVKFEVVVECKKKEEFKKITYEGPVEGIAELAKVVKSLKA